MCSLLEPLSTGSLIIFPADLRRWSSLVLDHYILISCCDVALDDTLVVKNRQDYHTWHLASKRSKTEVNYMKLLILSFFPSRANCFPISADLMLCSSSYTLSSAWWVPALLHWPHCFPWHWLTHSHSHTPYQSEKECIGSVSKPSKLPFK